MSGRIAEKLALGKRLLDQPFPNCLGDDAPGRAHVHFVLDVLDVALHGEGADVEQQGNIFNVLVAAHPLDNFSLSRCQACFGGGLGRAVGRVGPGELGMKAGGVLHGLKRCCSGIEILIQRYRHLRAPQPPKSGVLPGLSSSGRPGSPLLPQLKHGRLSSD